MTQECEHCAAAVAEAVALREATNTLLGTLDLNDDSRYYHAPALYLMELIANPSPAVAALKRRLARTERAEEEVATACEGLARMHKKLAPMPCGHPEACVTDEGACGWCEELAGLGAELGGTYMAGKVLLDRLSHAEALAALVPRSALLVLLADTARQSAERAAKDLNAGMIGVWHQVEDEARALAASIEDARREREKE